MVERMKYVNIMGPIERLGYAVDAYLSSYEIQLEYTSKVLPRDNGLAPIVYENPFTASLKLAERFVRAAGIEPKDLRRQTDMSVSGAVAVIERAKAHYDKTAQRILEGTANRDEYAAALAAYSPFASLKMRAEDIGRFEFVGYQFGKMPIAGLRQFETFLYGSAEIILFTGKTEETNVYCVYFSAKKSRDKTDSLFSSLHFEKTRLPMTVCGERMRGYISEVCAYLKERVRKLTERIEQDERDLIEAADTDENAGITKRGLADAYIVLRENEFNYGIRKYAAQTPTGFYIFVGWMTEREAGRLARDAGEDAGILFMSEDGREGYASKPPTKLKNLLPFRPFEMFVKMYGLPAYGEMDPTAFVALTYTLLFGIMFGDVGQGLVLSIGGLFAYKRLKMAIGKILIVVGFSGAVFGALFGSAFGLEFTPLLMRPAENTAAVLLAAVVMGVFLIIIPIIFNCFNAVKRGRALKAVFDPNGFAGLWFYGVIAVSAMLAVIGGASVSIPMAAALAAVPFLLIMFRGVITERITGARGETGEETEAEPPKHRTGTGMFIMETIIEMFEVLLAYLTNTISFVRVGAFALSHAAMMGVVLMLAETAKGGVNPVVLVLGNVFVIGLEGLIVGIQVLRLEFYELFSRFYEGSGRAFEPYKLQR